ncbi:replication initiation protein [Hoeflea sp. AS60]|uniref:replication initiation protein n=1 Tax=Hoeflea sp. AS60 TaxID=3135780 RepID=UPI00316C856C
MAVIEKYVREDGKIVVEGKQLRGDDIIRGIDRAGYRAGDWVKETSTSKRHPSDEPQIARERILIETMAIVGADELTAQDIAVHEYLMACARKSNMTLPTHRIRMSQLSDYLGVTQHERVWSSLERLMRTLVRYHVTDPKTNRRVCRTLLEAVSMSTNRLTQKTMLDYTIPGVIREAILQSRSYTWLDINVFPKFKSKYTGRLYPKLALMAGYDFRVRKDWKPTISELAAFIGYAAKGEDIHVASFMKVIDKALAEIDEHVQGFSVSCTKPLRGTGRGRAIPDDATFIIKCSDTKVDVLARRPAELTEQQIAKIEDRRHSPLEEIEHPPVKYFAQAQALTGIPAEQISDRWRMNVVDARLHPDKRFGIFSGGHFIQMLDSEGFKIAFKHWINWSVNVSGDLVREHVIPDYSIPVDSSGRDWIASEPWFKDDHWVDPELAMPEDVNLDSHFCDDAAPKIFRHVDDSHIPF